MIHHLHVVLESFVVGEEHEGCNLIDAKHIVGHFIIVQAVDAYGQCLLTVKLLCVLIAY